MSTRGVSLLATVVLLAPAAHASPEPTLWAREAAGLFSLDLDGLRAHLRAAPLGSADAAPVTLALPQEDGTLARFAVVESPVLEATLQERFPGIRTYRGQGQDDPSATVRLDLTPAGFHAMILSARGTLMIDPAAPGQTRTYRLATRRDTSGRPPLPRLV